MARSRNETIVPTGKEMRLSSAKIVLPHFGIRYMLAVIITTNGIAKAKGHSYLYAINNTIVPQSIEKMNTAFFDGR